MARAAIEATIRALKSRGPGILNRLFFERFQAVPGVARRLQAAAGPHKGGGDPHALGRALDIVLRNDRPWELSLGNALVDVFLDLRPKMGWRGVVYNQWEWNKSGVKSPRNVVCEVKPADDEEAARKKRGAFGSCMHFTHIHIEWEDPEIDQSGFESELAVAVAKLDDPTEDLLVGTWAAEVGGWKGLFFFDDEFHCRWADTTNPKDTRHSGKWKANATGLEWQFLDDPKTMVQRTFSIKTPVKTDATLTGDVQPGLGPFTMTKQA